MKKVQVGIAVMLIIHLALMGCNVSPSSPDGGEQAKSAVDPGYGPSPADETSLVTFWIEGVEARIRSYDVDSANACVDFEILVGKFPSNFEEYHLVIGSSKTGADSTFNRAVLNDVDELLLAGIAYTLYDRSGADYLNAVHEWTMDDSLTIETSIEGSIVTEQYCLNGEPRVYTYLNAEENAFKATPPEINDETEPSFVLRSKALQQISQWQELASESNSLNNNPDGELLVKILTNSEFNDWMAQEFGDGNAMRRVSLMPLKDLCYGAAACAKIKCLFGGGWMNFLCVACGGTEIACILAWAGSKIASLF